MLGNADLRAGLSLLRMPVGIVVGEEDYDIKTTAKFYAHVTIDDLRQAMDAESPMASPIADGSKERKAQ